MMHLHGSYNTAATESYDRGRRFSFGKSFLGHLCTHVNNILLIKGLSIGTGILKTSELHKPVHQNFQLVSKCMTFFLDKDTYFWKITETCIFYWTLN